MAEESFHKFYKEWFSRKHNLLHKLLSLSDSDSDHRNTVIHQVLSHYRQYLDRKSTLANHDVFLLFSPPWLSSYERTLLWISDYRPSLILRLVYGGAVTGVTAEQRLRLDQLKEETRKAERALTETMAGVQESVAGPAVLRLAGRVGREMWEVEAAMDRVRRGMIGVVEKADELRVTTATKVVAILTPPQAVEFFTAAAQFQIRVRKWGLQRDSQSRAQFSDNKFTQRG